MRLKAKYIFLYLIFVIAAFIAAFTKNPYILVFDCTMILAILIDKSNYEKSE